jgi:hypothetical protein
MRTLLLLICLLLPATLAAQNSSTFYAGLGATWSSKLVEDNIVSDKITTQPGIAPTIMVGGATEVFPQYDVDMELQFTTGSYSAETKGKGTTKLGTLRTFSASLGFDGPLFKPPFRWRASVGVLKYLPTEDTGLFLQGGPLDFLLGLGAQYRRQVSSSLDVSVALRYDFHRFTTEELQSQGFSQTQQVHRVGLTVGIAMGGRR